MGFVYILSLFIGLRIADWLTSYLAPFFIPYLGFFPYKEIAIQYNLPKFLTAFANFDGAHYLLIAKNGYTQYQQAFFPLYPLLVRWLSPLFFNNYLLTALVISNLAFLLGLWLFSKYLLEIGNWKLEIWSVFFLMTFPTSFFFGAVYTEGLFFLLLVAMLYFLKKEKYGLAALCTFLASLTRLIGVFLLIPILLSLIQKLKIKNQNDESKFKNKKIFLNYFRLLAADYRLLMTILSPVLGLALYSLYLFQTTGDPFFFLNSQWAFGAHRSSSIIFLPQVYYRYLNIFFTADFNFQYFIALFEFLTFNFVFIFLVFGLIKNFKLKIKNYDIISLGLFSLVNLLLPTFTGTFSSIPRYALFSLSFFIYLSQIKNISIKLAIAIIFVIFHIILLGAFSQGYFIS